MRGVEFVIHSKHWAVRSSYEPHIASAIQMQTSPTNEALDDRVADVHNFSDSTE
jgi:hypothetical protein